MELKFSVIILTVLLVKSTDLACIISSTTLTTELGLGNMIISPITHFLIGYTDLNPWFQVVTKPKIKQITTTMPKRLVIATKVTTRVITTIKRTTIKPRTTTKMTSRTSLRYWF